MKKRILFLLAGLFLLLTACEGAPAATAGTAETSPSATAAATGAEPEPEPVDYTGKEESLAFFSEEGTLEKKGAAVSAVLKTEEDLAPYAAFFSGSDLSAVKAMLEKEGETLIAEVFVNDPSCLFHLDAVAPESDFVLVSCSLEHPSAEEGEEIPEHGLHLFFVIHLDETYRQGLPLRFVLTDE